MPTRRFAILMLVLTTAAWGLSFPGGKALQDAAKTQLPEHAQWFFSSLMIATRFGLAALLLWLFHPRAFAQMRASELRQGIGLGVCGGLGMLLQADGLAFTEASTSAFLTQFASVLVPIVIALRTRRLPSLFVMFCVALVVAGVAVLAQLDWHTLRLGRGELETLIGTAFFTCQILWLERSVFRGNHTGRVTLVMFLTIAAILAPITIAHADHAADALVFFRTAPMALLLAALTLVCSLFAFLMMNRWQPFVDATTAGIVYCTEPIFGTIFALFLPALLAPLLGITYANEEATRHLLIGGALITVANILISLKPVAPPTELPPP
ncbi:MAG: EamA family transporter [Chthoniobacter sp.]|nr:EamA family transporter [Chthoniobacter sp.]